MSTFDIRELWREGSFFMTSFEFDNYATEISKSKVVCDLYDSCLMADDAIKKMMGKK